MKGLTRRPKKELPRELPRQHQWKFPCQRQWAPSRKRENRT